MSYPTPRGSSYSNTANSIGATVEQLDRLSDMFQNHVASCRASNQSRPSGQFGSTNNSATSPSLVANTSLSPPSEKPVNSAGPMSTKGS